MSAEVSKSKDYKNSWYALTPNRLLATLGVLKGEINCDVCIIGGGFTGLSAALELSKKGYSVILLEARALIDSASGKNGGHIIRGFTASPGKLSRKFDPVTARMLCNITLEGLALVIKRIAKHDIKCDLHFGHMTAAASDGQLADLKKSIADWAKIGHTDLKYVPKKEMPLYVRSQKYTGGMYDPKGAHFHPLNYALGIAQAAQAASCRFYDETPVMSIRPGSPARVVTEEGVVNAKFVIMGGHIKVPGVEKLDRKVVTATATMLATEPLGEKSAQKLLPKNTAFTDSGFDMNYFKLSPDHRLMFGGDSNYSGYRGAGEDSRLRQRMLQVFPELENVEIEHCWSSPMDITLNRLPHFGRLGDNIFYAHGYCGHNIILGNLAGKLIAEAVSGTAERFDVFERIGHVSFPGGQAVKRPLFTLAMTWNRLQDLLF